jgi:hypothetical protein
MLVYVPSDQILADAALAGDEHLAFGGRRSGRGLEQSQHLRVCDDQRRTTRLGI